MRKWTTEPGSPRPLGATYQGDGVNFAVFSEHATAVELCLYDRAGNESRIALTERSHDVWHLFVRDLHPGQQYGYRVHGPHRPDEGHRFNPSKLLLDPYARAFTHRIEPGPEFLSSMPGSPHEVNPMDTGGLLPKSVLIDPYFEWGGDRPPKHALEQTLIYETHVRGLTRRHPDVPVAERGTYAALAHPAVIAHLQSLGVTAVELLPVHAHVNDLRLRELGLSNYWGYNSIGFFAPEPSYAAARTPQQQVNEFKTMVRALHAAGIEIILDVVYNHAGEGNHLGQTLCFRGLDNRAYYRLAEDKAHYDDVTGTGNTINIAHPRVLQLVMDSLRYWVTEMHVDGFRFDLASALGRDGDGFYPGAAFFDAILQDPVLSGVKLISEPWDLGAFGYQVGGFPHPWSEWNGKYRDVLRSFWRGDGGMIDDLASRLAGSSDIYAPSRRDPDASVNFITSHDGFTLADLVAYNEKHNEANGEENHDGDSNNHSWNCGAEGPVDDAKILELRRRQRCNMVASLFLSQGVPMIFEGDELGRSKLGNNNTYCQDNELNWIDWRPGGGDQEFLEFVRALSDFRRIHPTFRRRHFFKGSGGTMAGNDADLLWFTDQGHEMDITEWHNASRHTVGMLVNGGIGLREVDETFFAIFHAGGSEISFVLPGTPDVHWRQILDTSARVPFSEGPVHAGDSEITVPSRSLLMFRLAAGHFHQACAASSRPSALLPEHPPTTELKSTTKK